MNKKMLSILILVVGIAVLVLFAIADVIGIGESPNFGTTQIAGTIVGAVLAVIGFILLCKK
jgi:hypothetical protein